MDLMRLLRESLRVMSDEPKVFVPRIATTIFYSALIFYSAKLSFDLSFALAQEAGRVSSNVFAPFRAYAGSIAVIVVGSVACLASDVLAYAMYPTLVNDFRHHREISLMKALGNAMSQWRTLAAFSATILAFMAAFIAFFFWVYARIILTDSIILLIPALLLMAAVFIAFSILIFFVIPVAVIERKGIIHAYRRSISLGFEHRMPLFKTTILFMGISFATIGVAAVSGFRGVGALLAFSVFLLTRLIQVVSYTYLNVVNPYVYLSLYDGKKQEAQ